MPTETLTRTSTRSTEKATRSPGRATAPRRATRKPRLLTFTTPEERHRMIELAAYYKAESRGFEGGDPRQDWYEAEVEIDARLAKK